MNMKTKVIRLFVVLLFLVSMCYPHNYAVAALHPDNTVLNALKELNIISNEKELNLNERPSRIEAALIIIRTLGKEDDGKYLNHDFDDIPDNADSQIGYLYNKEIIRGKSPSHYGNDAITFNEFMTMILRVLGYSDSNGDFAWNEAAEKSKELGVLTPKCFDEIIESNDFTYMNLVICVYSSLTAYVKNEEFTLLEKMLRDSVIADDQIKNTGIYDLLTAAKLNKSNSAHYTLIQEFTIIPTDTHSQVVLKVNIPDTYINRQTVKSNDFSIKPDEILSEDGVLYAKFTLSDLKETLTIIISTEIEISSYDLENAMKLHFPIQLTKEEEQEYTRPTKWIESDNDSFLAVDIGESDGNDINKLAAIMDYIAKNMSVITTTNDVSALTAFERGFGDCFDFSEVFIALCRSRNIPARMIICDKTDKNASGHALVEVFCKELGWVPIDPINIAIGTETLTTIKKNKYIYLSDNDHANILNGQNYYNWICDNCIVEVNEHIH